jgi:hypothetical protein
LSASGRELKARRPWLMSTLRGKAGATLQCAERLFGDPTRTSESTRFYRIATTTNSLDSR